VKISASDKKNINDEIRIEAL